MIGCVSMHSQASSIHDAVPVSIGLQFVFCLRNHVQRGCVGVWLRLTRVEGPAPIRVLSTNNVVLPVISSFASPRVRQLRPIFRTWPQWPGTSKALQGDSFKAALIIGVSLVIPFSVFAFVHLCTVLSCQIVWNLRGTDNYRR